MIEDGYYDGDDDDDDGSWGGGDRILEEYYCIVAKFLLVINCLLYNDYECQVASSEIGSCSEELNWN